MGIDRNYDPLPTTAQSVREMQGDVDAALRYLRQKDCLDVAEMLGLVS